MPAIRLLKPAYLPPGQHEMPAGTVADVPDDLAAQLIAAGAAEPANPPAPPEPGPTEQPA